MAPGNRVILSAVSSRGHRRAVALHFVTEGARVIDACREAETLGAAVKEIGADLSRFSREHTHVKEWALLVDSRMVKVL